MRWAWGWFRDGVLSAARGGGPPGHPAEATPVPRREGMFCVTEGRGPG
ncbi:MAG: hypothetical protein INH41_07545 [Myxococcaceae bacterium]|nr:hypothetical protein [Myxococcaceae bacterium]